MSLPDKIGQDGMKLVNETLLSLAGLLVLETHFCATPSQKAIKENLHNIGVHSGMKRFLSEERFMPSTFMAILQYEMMMELQKKFIQDPLLKIVNQYGLQVIRTFRKFFVLPSFEVEDEIIGVEVYPKGSEGEDEGEIMRIEDIDKLEREKYEFKRALPVRPQAIGVKIKRWMGFVNSCGDLSKASERIKQIFGVSS